MQRAWPVLSAAITRWLGRMLRPAAMLLVLTVNLPAYGEVNEPPASERLFAAIAENNQPLVQILVEAGAPLRARNDADQTPAAFALSKGHYAIAQYLLSYRPPAEVTAPPPAPQSQQSTRTSPLPPPPKRPKFAAVTEPKSAALPPPRALDPVPQTENPPPLTAREVQDIIARRDLDQVPPSLKTPPLQEDDQTPWTAELLDQGPDTTGVPAPSPVVRTPAPDAPLREPQAESLFDRMKTWVSDLFEGDDDAPLPAETSPRLAEADTRQSALSPPRLPERATPPATSDRADGRPDRDGLGYLDDNPAVDVPTPRISVPDDLVSDEPTEDTTIDLVDLDRQARLDRLDALLAQTPNPEAAEVLETARQRARAQRLAEQEAAFGGPGTNRRVSSLPVPDQATDTSRITEPGPDIPRAPTKPVFQAANPPLPLPDPDGRSQVSRDPWLRDIAKIDARARDRTVDRAAAPETSKPDLVPDGEAPPPPPGNQRDLVATAPEQRSAPKPFTSIDYGIPPPPSADEVVQQASPTLPSAPRITAERTARSLPTTPSPSGDALLDALTGEASASDADASEASALDALLADGPSEPTAASPDDEAALLDALTGEGVDNGDALLDQLEDVPAPAAPTGAAPSEAESPKITLKLAQDGRPILPNPWTDAVVRPGQDIPEADIAFALREIAPLASLPARAAIDEALAEQAPATPETTWDVTNIVITDQEGKEAEIELGPRLSKVSEPAAASTTPAPQASAGATLSGVDLTLGIGVSLTNLQLPEKDEFTDRRRDCLEKNEGRVAICITELRWPAAFQEQFLISTILYTETSAIVRYDKGVASHMLALFQTDAFEEIASWLAERYGPAAEQKARDIAPFGEQRRDNPVLIWKSTGTDGAPVRLEMRRFDDTRGGFPDMRYSAIMLYREGAPTIFPGTSIHELIRLKRTD